MGEGEGHLPSLPDASYGPDVATTDLVGDEFHYLFVCHESSLRQRRQVFINDIQKVNTNFNMFD